MKPRFSMCIGRLDGGPEEVFVIDHEKELMMIDEKTKLPNGLFSPAAEVLLENSSRILVPLSNLEIVV